MARASRPTGTRSCSPTSDLLDALWVTLQVAAVAVIVATVLGSLLGLGLARLRFRGARRDRDAAAAADGHARDHHGHQPADLLQPAARARTARSARSRSPTSRSASRTWRSWSALGRSSLDPRLEEAARDLGASASGRLLARDPAADRAGRRGRGDAGVRAVVRRPRRDLVQRGRRLDDAADLHLQLDQVRRLAADQRDLDDHRRGRLGRPVHRAGGPGPSVAATRESSTRTSRRPARRRRGGRDRARSHYHPTMDATSAPILEIGLILLAAVAAGWVARRLGLPAIVGYLAVGLGFSPFTPGLRRGPRPARAARRRRRRAAALRGRHRGGPRRGSGATMARCSGRRRSRW